MDNRPVFDRPTVDLEGMSDQLADIRPNKGAVGTLDALNAAIDHLGEHANAKREILCERLSKAKLGFTTRDFHPANCRTD